jgi:hypothetical protein
MIWRDRRSARPELAPAVAHRRPFSCSTTGHPVYIWWGAEDACLYHDAYRASIGPERHPARSLARSVGRHGRFGRIWDVIGPQIEQVWRGGSATWHENQLVPITAREARGRLLDVQLSSDCGALTIRSMPGQGTTTELWLTGGSGHHRLPERRLNSNNRSGVDWEPFFLSMTRGPHEHRPLLADLALPFEAYSAEEALRIIDSDMMIDVLIADHVMPGMIGVDLACAARKRRLRQSRTRRSTARIRNAKASE